MSVNTYNILRCDHCGKALIVEADDRNKLLLPDTWRRIVIQDNRHQEDMVRHLCEKCLKRYCAFINIPFKKKQAEKLVKEKMSERKTKKRSKKKTSKRKTKKQ